MNAIERMEEAIRGAELTEKTYGGHALAPVMKADAEAFLEIAQAARKYRRVATPQSLARFLAALHRLQEDTP